jgi:hypothetical protein
MAYNVSAVGEARRSNRVKLVMHSDPEVKKGLFETVEDEC